MTARLGHFAVVVRDLEKSAKFYQGVFGLSDSVINLALLNYFGKRGSGLDDASNYVGAEKKGWQGTNRA